MWRRRATLAVHVWRAYLRVLLLLRRHRLPEVVALLGTRSPGLRQHPPARLNRAVDRCLRLGRLEARCLTAALVLYHLLHDQGEGAQLVIGVPPRAHDHRAHAWVELDGRVVGPPPGRNGHAELGRFGP